MSDYFRFKSAQNFNSHKRRKQKKKYHHFLSKIIILIFLVLFIYLIIYSLLTHVTFETLFMIKKVRIMNTNIVNDSVFDSIRTEIGRNLLNFEDSSYKRQILRNSWVKDVQISKHYPNRIKVKVEEKKPIFLNYDKISKQWYGITKTGQNILWPQNSLSLPILPIIEKIYNLDTIEFYHFVSFLEELKGFDRMLYNNISQIVVERMDEIKIWINDYPIWFVFSLDIEQRKSFSLWIALLQNGRDFFKNHEYLDLRVSGYGYLK